VLINCIFKTEKLVLSTNLIKKEKVGMNRGKATLFGLLVIVLGIALGFSTMKDDPRKGNPTDSRKNESINPVQQDGPRLPIGGYDTDGTPYYTDNFDGANDTTSLKSRGYYVWYRGTGIQGSTATWYQGVETVFSAYNGPTTGYVAANYNVVTGTNNIDSWLITPANNVTAGDSIVFYSRSATGSIYPDSIRVMYSAAGSTTPEGTWSELGRFKTNTAGVWERRVFGAPSSAAVARFAIRYCVVNGGPTGANSDYIGVDALTIEGATIANDIAASANIAPIGSIVLPTSTIAPKATFTNLGVANQTNIPVRYSITGPVNYTSNKVIAALNAGTSTTVTFDSTFNPAGGTYNVTIIASLANDGNRANDTLRTSFTVTNPNYGTSGTYSYANSVIGSGAPSSPDYCWKDTSGSTSLVVNSTNASTGNFLGTLDDGHWKFKLPAGKKVKMGGIEYDSVFVATNGFISFAQHTLLNSFSPAINSLNRPTFYAMWMDLNYSSIAIGATTNRLSYKVNGYQLIVTYDRVPAYGADTTEYVTMQAVIALVEPGFPSNSNMLVQFADGTNGNTGADFLAYYNTDLLNSHVIGLQIADGTTNAYYRTAYPVNPPGPMFGASPIAIEFGPNALRLNSSCDAATLNLTASIEAITPDPSPSSNTSDTITVLLRAGTAPYEIVDAARGVLSAAGSVSLSFTKANLGSSYYIVVKHRNSIETWSANPVNLTAVTSYNFTTGVGQAYGSNMIVVSGAASFYSGDTNQDGTIDGSDGSLVDNDAFNFVSGYVSTDVNNDGFVDASDASYVENNSSNFIGVIRP
jgi:hypothetical protein